MLLHKFGFGEKITVNFENVGKKVINGNIINLEKFKTNGNK